MAAQRAQKEREARVLLKSLGQVKVLCGRVLRQVPSRRDKSPTLVIRHEHESPQPQQVYLWVSCGPDQTRHQRIQAVNAAKTHLTDIVPNAVDDLKEVAFPDSRSLAIQRPGAALQRSAVPRFLSDI